MRVSEREKKRKKRRRKEEGEKIREKKSSPGDFLFEAIRHNRMNFRSSRPRKKVTQFFNSDVTESTAHFHSLRPPFSTPNVSPNSPALPVCLFNSSVLHTTQY